MTHTKTYALVTPATVDAVETVTVRRRPTEAQAFYLPSGSYRVQTISGQIEVDAPTWIVFDDQGFPYPVDPAVFDRAWARATEHAEAGITPRQQTILEAAEAVAEHWQEEIGDLHDAWNPGFLAAAIDCALDGHQLAGSSCQCGINHL